MIGVFLQVRLGSRRLPRKALLPLGGKAVIEHAMEALKEFPADRYVLLTDQESAWELRGYAQRAGFELFAGDRDNVLSRFVSAADAYGVDAVVRATGDNPLVASRVVKVTHDLFQKYHSDYAAITGTPLGTGVELLRADALRAAVNAAPDKYEREHVSPFLYRRPDRFQVQCVGASHDIYLPEERVTLDTEADYAKLTSIYETLYQGRPIPIECLVLWLRQQQQSHRSAMKTSA